MIVLLASSGLSRSREAALRVRLQHAGNFAWRTLARFKDLLDTRSPDGELVHVSVTGVNRFVELLNTHNSWCAGSHDHATIPTRRGSLHWQATQIIRVLRACGFVDFRTFVASVDWRTELEIRHDIEKTNYGRLLRAYVVAEGIFTLEEVRMSEEEFSYCREILDSLTFNSDENMSYGARHVCNRRFKRFAIEHVLYLRAEIRRERLTDIPAALSERSALRNLGILGSRPGPEVERDPWATGTLEVLARSALR